MSAEPHVAPRERRPPRPGRGRLLRALGILALAGAVALLGLPWNASLRPDTYSPMAMGVLDPGGGPIAGGEAGHDGHGTVAPTEPDASAVSVSTLIADPERAPDVRVELTARAERFALPGGEQVDGYTLNGQSPGPEIRAAQGELVEVLLRNEDVAGGATLHWHGVDVPAAMDGVAGVTQDAVRPGEAFTYRFVAQDAGSYWYHSHQVSHAQVIGGLFGALVIEPAGGSAHDVDVAALLHTYPSTSRTIDGIAGERRVDAPAGALVRVRIANTDNVPTVAWVAGAGYRLLAIDGTDVLGPTDVTGQKVQVTAGGRVDLEVRVPDSGAVRVHAPGVSLVVGPPGAAAPGAPAPEAFLDPLHYGSPAALGFDPAAAGRRFDYDIGRAPGFLDGRPGIWWTINGRMGDDAPAFLVREGDVVAMRVTNGSGEVHPMHLHGHHVVVLARDGVPATGSPWWVDSLHVDHGETYDVAFVADNPGIWMDHCHNLPHAVEGLMTHVMYEGVTTPFLVGRGSGNEPE